MELESPFTKNYKNRRKTEEVILNITQKDYPKHNLTSLLDSSNRLKTLKGKKNNFKNKNNYKSHSIIREGSTTKHMSSGFWLNSSISRKNQYRRKRISRVKLVSLDFCKGKRGSVDDTKASLYHFDHLFDMKIHGKKYFFKKKI